MSRKFQIKPDWLVGGFVQYDNLTLEIVECVEDGFLLSPTVDRANEIFIPYEQINWENCIPCACLYQKMDFSMELTKKYREVGNVVAFPC